ncbi:hypothetical protein ACQP1W_24965 [Spirillospora sp. CA-255316]
MIGTVHWRPVEGLLSFSRTALPSAGLIWSMTFWESSPPMNGGRPFTETMTSPGRTPLCAAGTGAPDPPGVVVVERGEHAVHGCLRASLPCRPRP